MKSIYFFGVILQLDRAKLLFAEDKKFKKGFKFDHVWKILKDFAKFDDSNPTPRQRFQIQNTQSSESENQGQHCNTLPSFNLNLTSEESSDGGSSSSKRPMGIKSAKLKKKKQEEMSSIFSNMEARDEKLMEMLQKAEEDRKRQLELQEHMIELRKKRDEDNVFD